MGWIYVLTHDRIPGLVKIGFTDTSIDQRISQISDNAGVPGKYNLVYSYEAKSAEAIERIIHKELSNYRYNSRKEFFEIPIEYAVIITKLICEREDIRLGSMDNGIEINSIEDIGKTIKSGRRKSNQTQFDISSKSGLYQKTISAAESGNSGIKLLSIIKILKAMGLKLVIIG